MKGTAEVVGELKLHEAYDILDAMKRIVDEDSGSRAKSILEAYPQLVSALLEIQVMRKGGREGVMRSRLFS